MVDVPSTICCGEASVASAIETWQIKQPEILIISCGEASVASAIETIQFSGKGVCFPTVAGKQASRLRLKHSRGFGGNATVYVAGKQASRLRLKLNLQYSLIESMQSLRGSKRRVCD